MYFYSISMSRKRTERIFYMAVCVCVLSSSDIGVSLRLCFVFYIGRPSAGLDDATTITTPCENGLRRRFSRGLESPGRSCRLSVAMLLVSNAHSDYLCEPLSKSLKLKTKLYFMSTFATITQICGLFPTISDLNTPSIC